MSRKNECKVWNEVMNLFVQEFRNDNGELEGERKCWYATGQMQSRDFRKDGMRDGYRRSWWPNGHLYEDQFYRYGMLEGKCKTWHGSGQILAQEFYRDGRLEGERKFHYSEKDFTVKFWRRNFPVDEHFTLNKKIILLRLKRELRCQMIRKRLDLQDFIISDLFGIISHT